MNTTIPPTTPTPSKPKNKQQGFTLIELSIVLVIIGLIVGGVLVGQSLIRAAELRAVISEFNNYQTAVNTFRLKYNGLPGDLKNATTFWGEAHATPNTCKATIGSGTQTCNGDGDRIIGNYGDASEYYEMHRFWQHLSNAGLVSGSYTGVAADGNGASVLTEIGLNAPRSKVSKVGWSISYISNYGGDTGFYALDYQNHFILGAQSAGEYTYGKSFTPEEVWNIDTKIDDGKPGQGRAVLIYWDECTNASASNDLAADYDLTNTTIDCSIIFRKVF